MAESFPETPMMTGQPTLGWSKRAPNFFPDTPPGGGGGGGDSGSSSGKKKAGSRRRTSSPEDSAVLPTLPAEVAVVAPVPPRRITDDDDADAERVRQDHLLHDDDDDGVGEDVEEDDDTAVDDVRSGRLDTLGWVSASWEPRCVILRTDGSMSVQPLGMGRKLAQQQKQEQLPQERQQQERQQQEKQQQQRATALPTPPQWSPMVKFNKPGAGGRSATSTSAKTERMTSWASNSSTGSMISGASSRVVGVGGFLGSNSREPVSVVGSPASSVASGTGSFSDKVTNDARA